MSAVTCQGYVAGTARRRADIDARQLNPGVREMVFGLIGKANDNFRRLTLLGEESVMDERVYETPWRMASERQHGRNDSSETRRRDRKGIAMPNRTQLGDDFR